MTNLERAKAAETCLDTFAFLTGVDDVPDAVGDLVANLGHYCQANRLDFLRLVGRGIGHWHVEQANPDSIDELPDVTITIAEELVS